MSHLLNLFNGILTKSSKQQIDDDVIDRLYHKFTTGVLVVFAIIVSTSQYAGDPIECWSPAHFTSNHVKYMNSYCWSYGTYYLPFDERVEEKVKSTSVHYYQWVPILLLLQAVVTYVPVFMWKYAVNKSSVNIKRLIGCAKTVAFSDVEDDRTKALESIRTTMKRYRDSRKINNDAIFSTKSSKFLFACYVAYKITCLVSIVFQLIALNLFLRNNFYSYGADFLKYLFGGESWIESYRFPRVTMCDLEIRRLGNVHSYTVQCVLPINIFNEKIYLFIWFWLVFISVANLLSTIYWIAFTLSTAKKLAVKYDIVDINDNIDSIFLLKLIKTNTNAITGDEILQKIYGNGGGSERTNSLETDDKTAESVPLTIISSSE